MHLIIMAAACLGAIYLISTNGGTENPEANTHIPVPTRNQNTLSENQKKNNNVLRFNKDYFFKHV